MSGDASHLTSNWNFPTKVIFGPGRIRSLAEACKQAGMRRPLLVTDPGLAGLAMVRDALAANEAVGLPTGLFSNIKGNPNGQNVEDGVRAFNDGNHDGVIAFGGGSGLDAGKVIAFQSGQSLDWAAFEDKGDNWTKAKADAIAPIIAVPTTAGTGSETGRAGVITDERDHTKKIIFHPKLLPVTVISDPELTVGLPPQVTAATGMDALSHCLEAYCAPGYQPLCEGIAVEGMRLIKNWLPVAYHDGANIEARAHMLAAASMGATAFQKGLGAMHALAHPIGALYDTHHGLTNAVLMPYVLVANRSVIEEKIARLAAWLELPNPSFDTFLDWIVSLRSELNIANTLDQIGLDDRRLDDLAAMAVEDPSAGGNPIACTVGSMKAILEAALAGKL